MNATLDTIDRLAEEIRQSFRDGSMAQKASTLIREESIEREEAERRVIAGMIRRCVTSHTEDIINGY